MTFDEILDQVIALLKRQGRVSYRALKMRFDEIDDQYLDVLKEEILFAYPVIDKEGRGFVWTGEAETQPESTVTETLQPKIIQKAQPTQAEPPPPEPAPPVVPDNSYTLKYLTFPAFLLILDQDVTLTFRSINGFFQRR